MPALHTDSPTTQWLTYGAESRHFANYDHSAVTGNFISRGIQPESETTPSGSVPIEGSTILPRRRKTLPLQTDRHYRHYRLFYCLGRLGIKRTRTLLYLKYKTTIVLFLSAFVPLSDIDTHESTSDVALFHQFQISICRFQKKKGRRSIDVFPHEACVAFRLHCPLGQYVHVIFEFD